MVGKCLGGVEEDLESIAADVEDDDMLLPCLEVTLKVIYVFYFPSDNVQELRQRWDVLTFL